MTRTSGDSSPAQQDQSLSAKTTPQSDTRVTDLTEDEAVSHLSRVGDTQTDSPPTQKDILLDPKAPSPSDFIILYGSWVAALMSAGYSTTSAIRQHREISTIEIIESMQKLSVDGVAPTQERFHSHPDTPASTTVKRRMGWEEAVKSAGLKVNPKTVKKRTDQPNDISEEEMITAMQELAVEGVAPTQKQYTECEDTPAASTVQRRIGWLDAIERAGLEKPD